MSEPVSGLAPGTTYHWRICAQDEREQPPRTVCSADQTFTTSQSTTGPGGPILVVASPSDPFSRYYAEILRAEGLNEFEVATGPVTSAMLAGKEVVILGSQALTDAQVTLLANWVQGGGNLIAMRPDKRLAGLLGLTDAGGTRTNQYLKVDTDTAAGAGIEGQTLQFHGTADRYTLNGASLVARLYSTATTSTTNPAVTLRSVGTSRGSGGRVHLRPGALGGLHAPGQSGVGGPEARRHAATASDPNDLFYGAKAGDVQPDWVDMSKIDVPQADEQQRLLANLITRMNLDRGPAAALLVPAARGEGRRGHDGRRSRTERHAGLLQPLQDDQRAGLLGGGLGVRSRHLLPLRGHADERQPGRGLRGRRLRGALHVHTSCGDFTPASLETLSATSWPTSRPRGRACATPPRTAPTAWCGATGRASHRSSARTASASTRPTTTSGPPGWLTRPGLLTGSGFPQRFADLDGSTIDVYQAMTQITDESDLPVAEQADVCSTTRSARRRTTAS